nr:methyl-accepting chemotaxis protein [Spirochaetia bacterium]
DNSREAGNIIMDNFDPVSVDLTKMIDKQVGGYTAVFDTYLTQLSENQNKIIQMLIIISIVTILITVLMGIYIFVSLGMGIKLISKYSLKLANNDISDSKKIIRRDEFGVSAGQFISSFKLLNTLISNIKTSTNTTADIKDSLSAAAEESTATIVNITNSTSALLKQSEKMDNNVSDNVAAVEAISANINSIKDQINEQVAMVEESTAAITEMIASLHSVDNITRKKSESVLRLVAAIEGGNDASAATDVKFQVDVIDKIDGISGMAESIQAIAAQTNLLSMNAAIEAAHAGDAGKGFAVVADEIRNLADTSAKSSAKITKIIKEISDGIAGTGEVAQRKIDAFVVMNKEILETKNAFDEIVTSVQELNSGGAQIQEAMVVLQDVSSNIKNAAAEMTVGAEQVIRGQLGLKDISGNVSRGIQEISSGSEEIVIAADEIVKYSSDLNGIVNDLKEETDKFKV